MTQNLILLILIAHNRKGNFTSHLISTTNSLVKNPVDIKLVTSQAIFQRLKVIMFRRSKVGKKKEEKDDL